MYIEKVENFERKKAASKCPIIIAPESSSLTVDFKKKMKELKFKWNLFRKEFYGFGDIEDIKNQMKPFDCKISIAC